MSPTSGRFLQLPIILASASSWVVLLIWTNSPFAIYMGHSQLEFVETIPSFLFSSSIFLLGWGIMIAAMMLPGTLSVIREFSYRKRKRLNQSALAFGFILPWMVVGIGFYLFDLGIHRLTEASSILGQNLWVLSVSTIAIAGIYELTPIKRNYINDCCYPGDLIQTYNPQEKLSVFRMGSGFGKSTIGCSWNLMFLMFALGLGSIFWMLIVGLIMLTERVSKIGPNSRLPLGIVLLVIAFFLFVPHIVL